MALRFRIVGLDKATGELRAGVQAGVQIGLNVAGARGEALVKNNIASPFLGRGPAVASGVLVNSVGFDPVTRVDISRVEIKAFPPAEGYAAYVEAGTGPHFPPPSALVGWVKKKFHIGNEKQALSIAFAVARKIARRGTSAFGMFARAYDKLQGELKGIFEAAIGGELQKRGLRK